MNARTLAACVLAACALAAPPVARSLTGTDDSRRAALNVGVVDLEEVLSEHPRSKSALDRAKKERNADLDGLKEKREKRKQLVQTKDLYKPDSKEWLDIDTEIKILDSTFKLDREVIVAKYGLALYNAMSDVYDEVLRTVDEVAKEKGLQLVFNYPSDRSIGGGTHVSFLNRLTLRDLAYAEGSLDITDAVLERIK